jgi:hypothetical protein
MDKQELIAAMRSGRKLVGPIGDFGRPLRLESRDEQTWDNVAAELVIKMLTDGDIREGPDRGHGQREYVLSN